MNEWQRRKRQNKSVPSSAVLAISRINTAIRFSNFLGFYSKRIYTSGILSNVTNPIGQIWSGYRYSKEGLVIVHLAVMLLSASYLTLALFSRVNAAKYWWLYAILVLVFSGAGTTLGSPTQTKEK